MTRQDLAPGYALTQTVHAMADFSISHPREFQQWHSSSNYLACLSVKDEQSLQALEFKLLSEGIKHTTFREPDIQNQITAIAIEPSDRAKRICSSFPLALKNLSSGITKHTYSIQQDEKL